MSSTVSAHDHRRLASLKMQQSGIDGARLLAVLSGAVIGCYGLTRRSLPGVALAMLGGALAATGIKAGSPIDDALHVRCAITINRPRHEVYELWRDLEGLPRAMKHLRAVQRTSEGRSRWAVRGPLGRTVEWEAETTQQQQDAILAWRSRPGALVPNHGIVRFADAPEGRGTQIELTMSCRPPVGPLGAAVALLTGRTPQAMAEGDLRRFKAVVEGGEAPTTTGQPAGARAVIGRVANAWAATR